MSRRQQRARHARRKQANTKMRALGVAGGVAVASLGAAVPAQADFDHVYTVTTLADTGPGSLNDAITQANGKPGNDQITFQAGLNGSIPLTSDLPAIATQLTISGPGANLLTLDASQLTQSQAILTASSQAGLSVSGLSLKNAQSDGAISVSGTPTTLTGDEIDSNKNSSGNGGGVAVSGGSLTVSGSTFAYDSAHSGGAIADSGAPLTVQNSTLNDNQATAGNGGGILFTGAAGTITSATFAYNGAKDVGAGGFNGRGGGVSAGSGASLTLQNSILANNAALGAGNVPSPSTTHKDVDLQGGATATAEYSLIGAASSAGDAQTDLATDGTDLLNEYPNLGTLENNGGGTQTLLPPAGSPVIDRGNDEGLTTDQRGLARPFLQPGTTEPSGGDGSDIGAVELQAAPTVTGVTPGTGSAGDTITITGTGFTGAEEVDFNSASTGNVTAAFTVVSDTEITATVPSGTGTFDVTVIRDLPSATSSADQFTTVTRHRTYTVTSLADSGPGSLRQEILDADNDAVTKPADDTITFAPGLTGTIPLASNLPAVTTQLTIQGPGARVVKLDASGDTQGGNVLSASSQPGLTVTGLTLSGANGDAFVDTHQTSLTLDGDTIAGNAVQVAAVDTDSELTVQDSTLSGNTSAGSGGAILGQYADLQIIDSTITGNQAAVNGGGIYLDHSDAAITGSTITGNTVDFTGPGTGHNGYGGGIAAYQLVSVITLHDSVIAGNSATGNPIAASGADVHRDIDLAGGATATAAFSLIQNDSTQTGFSLDGSDITGQDPKLGTLANNGGPTDTELPGAGSPAIDSGAAYGQTTDQRGLVRPVTQSGTTIPSGGDGSDMGAAELQAPPVVAGVSPATGPAGTSVTITGSGFTHATGVSFGTAPAAAFTVTDDGHITATAPAGSGTADVRVATPDGESAVATAGRFAYPPPPPSPTPTTTTTKKTTAPAPVVARPVISGLSAHSGSSGQPVTISGSHLTGVSAVRFGSVTAKFRVTSDGSITATVPSSHGTVDVTVTRAGGTSPIGSGDRFSYLVASIGHHGPSAKWKGSSVVVDTGVFASCPGGGDRCSVSVKATSTVPASLAKVRKAKTKSLTLGSASFHVSAGKRGEVTFTLTRKGLKALAKLGKLKITVVVTVVDGSVTTKQSRTITIHLPKKPKPKKR